MSLDPRLLELLACPVCHGPLVLCEEEDPGLECGACRLVYPVRDGIPVMLEEEARPSSGDPQPR